MGRFKSNNITQSLQIEHILEKKNISQQYNHAASKMNSGRFIFVTSRSLYQSFDN